MTTASNSEVREQLATVPISEVLERWNELKERVSHGERVIVERDGKAFFALVPVEDAEYMRRLEDEQDVAVIRQAKAEGGPFIPWEDVKKELGL